MNSRSLSNFAASASGAACGRPVRANVPSAPNAASVSRRLNLGFMFMITCEAQPAGARRCEDRVGYRMLPSTRLILPVLAMVTFGSAYVVGDRQPASSQPKAANPAAANAKVKALVGGTLIDGYGGRPIRNSVVLVDGE